MAKQKRKTFRNDAELIKALQSDDYSIRSAAVDAAAELFASLAPSEAIARAQRWCDDVLKSGTAGARQVVGYTCLPVLAQHMPAGEELPARYDALFTGYGAVDRMRTVLQRIPAKRRLAALRRVILGDDNNASLRSKDEFLDLLPNADAAELERERQALRDKRHREEAAKAPKPEPKQPGTLTFTEPSEFWPEHYGELSAVEKAQFRAAGSAFFGGVVKSGDHFVKRLPAHDLDASDREWRRWKVLQNGTHRYDVWVFWVDNATVFPAGKTTRAPVYQIQGSWLPLNKRAPAVALADDFARSAPSDLWTVKPRKPRRDRLRKRA